jgi:WD40 repeat protein
MKTPFRWLVKGLLLGSVLVSSAVMAQDGLPEGPNAGWSVRPTIRSAQPLLSSGIAPHEPLLLAATDTGIFAWNYETGQGQWGITDLGLALGEEVRHFSYSPDGKLLLAGAETFEQPGKLFLYDMAQRQQLKALTVASVPTAIAFSPNGQQVAVGFADNAVRLYSLPALAEVKKLDGLTTKPTAFLWSKDGKTLQAAGGSHTKANLDKNNWQPNPETGGMGITEQTQGQAVRWDVESGKLEHKFNIAPGGPGMAYNAQGTMLASISGAVRFEKQENRTLENWEGNRVSVFELAADAKTAPKPMATFNAEGDSLRNGPIPILTWSPDGTHLVFTNSSSSQYFIWNGNQTASLQSEEFSGAPTNRVFFSPKGDQIIAVSGLTIHVWQKQEGEGVQNAEEGNDDEL